MIIKSLFALVGNAITDAMYIDGLEDEDPSDEWAADTYTLGDVVHVVATHTRYRDSAGGASAVSPELEPTRWVDIGPTNKWAMFDGYVSTRTLIPAGTSIVMQPGYFNSIELRGVRNCNGITITVKDEPDGTVLPGFPFESDMEGSEPGDDWDYEYMPFYPRETLLLKDIEPFSTAEVTITFDTDAGDVEIGKLSFGELRPLAATLNGSEARFSDYSYVDIDPDTGENVVEKGANARDLVITGWLPSEDAFMVDRSLQELLGVPVSVYASTATKFEGLSTFGLINARLRYPDTTQALLSAEVQGLI